jgi:S-methylmethionine-dependent homocysteine/selenocysteine methylase
MLNLDLPQTALLDGGMGRELRFGGCCGTRPAHIARLRELLNETEQLK